MKLKESLLIILAITSICWFSCKSDVDTDMPYILLEGENPYYINGIGGTFTEPGFKAVDDIDGDLTSLVEVTYPTILSDSARTYEVIYKVGDKSGNVFTTKRSIVVRNTSYIIEGFFSNCSQIRDTTNDSLFSVSVIPSYVTNNEFDINNFGNLGYGIAVHASLDTANSKIIINTPQLLADSSTLDFVDADSTYYSYVNDTLRFQVFYSHSKNGNSEFNKSYYRK